MLRSIVGCVAGVVTWIVVVTALNLMLRHGWPDYAAVEKAMTFTLPMMIARLSESGVSSLASGTIAAKLARTPRAALIAGGLLLLAFLPVHYALWQRFPVWYHLTFLASLPLLSWFGGKVASGRRPFLTPMPDANSRRP